MFDWFRAFKNTNVNEKVLIINKAVLNIPSNLILHETLTVDHKEHLWFTKKIKNLIHKKSNVFKAIEIVQTIIIYNTRGD